jgi:hypothetical protein
MRRGSNGIIEAVLRLGHEVDRKLPALKPQPPIEAAALRSLRRSDANDVHPTLGSTRRSPRPTPKHG